CQQIWVQKPPTGARTAAAAVKGNVTYTAPTGPTVQNQSVYWDGTTNAVAPSQYGPATSTTTVKRHVVQKGESLYAIYKRYVCAKECIRRANDFALTGNVTLQIGQALIIPGCTCQMPGYVAPRTPATTGPPPLVSNILNPQTTPQQPY